MAAWMPSAILYSDCRSTSIVFSSPCPSLSSQLDCAVSFVSVERETAGSVVVADIAALVCQHPDLVLVADPVLSRLRRALLQVGASDQVCPSKVCKVWFDGDVRPGRDRWDGGYA